MRRAGQGGKGVDDRPQRCAFPLDPPCSHDQNARPKGTCGNERLRSIIHQRSKREELMAWTTPVLVEICIGLEINGYLPPEF